ncbi:hypothetical protein [Streptomyces sp. CBMA152]|uniref:hypothetical protein n=1 Tax=Streptomyces sp. CBMA152 TaxID=1896312 RepID=UPI001661216D|nr:hypothetical protein [Streptomyces sp. CBMA152]
MYTLLFLLIALCVVAVLRDWPRRARLLMWSSTLALSFIAFLPHVIDHSYQLAF